MVVDDAEATTATGKNTETNLVKEIGCDRRLSRAARKLVYQHLLRVPELQNSILYHGFLDQSDVWLLLEHWMHANGKRMDQCPLNPVLDAYRIDEEHSVAIEAPTRVVGAYPTFVVRQRRKSKRKRAWFKCGYNGKTFSSRYYLDAHLDKHHKLDESSTFCPALDWCKAVGVANCHATALQDEPYYGRGSNGWGDDGNLLKHKWVKKSHSIPCTIATIREDCHSIMDRCGITDASQHWCDSLTCPTHRLSDVLLPVDWIDGARSGFFSFGGFLMAIVALSVYCCIYFQISDFEDEFGPRGKGRDHSPNNFTTSSKNGMQLRRIGLRPAERERKSDYASNVKQKQGKGD